MAVVPRGATRLKRIRETGLSIDRLVANTPAYVRNAAGYVALRELKQLKDGTVRGKTTTQILGERQRIHVQRISLVQGESWRNGTVKCNCDCEFFTYVCEVALHRHGAADIIGSNGAFPHATNPRGVPLLCKHLWEILRKLKTTKGPR